MTGDIMDKEQLIKDLKSFTSNHIIPDVPCCEDSTYSYDAYNNISNMYNHEKVESVGIRFFLNYDIDINDLSNKLDVEYDKLNDMFRFNQTPSKGLVCAICLLLNFSLKETMDILNKFAYKFLNNDSDKIISYFFINDIRDVSLLNEMLVKFGCMYLYSKKKLR